MQILLAEDNPINRKLMTALLSKAGYEFDVVENGEAAVQACSKQRYSVVLMDCQMPVLDGLDATRRIRDLDIPQPIIIAVTAHARPCDRNECLRSGMNDYVSKPFQSSFLMERIRVAIEYGT